MAPIPVERKYEEVVAASTSYAKNKNSGEIARYHVTDNKGRGYVIIWIEGHQCPYPLTESEWEQWEDYDTNV